ncbi:MAG: phage tail sheath family protein [Planctomycetes bacterium]|nr:phage tail sheath family protein [Planctomycetota bacterium]
MPSSLSYPGVYIEEIPSGVRAITGVATSITAFVGSFPRGPLDEAVRIFSFGDFERIYGGLAASSHASYAIQQFFLNGGSQAYVVRVGHDGSTGTAPAVAAVDVPDALATVAFTVSAANAGAWGNRLRVEVDYNTTAPMGTFNMTVAEVTTVNGREQVVAVETFRNLAMNASLAERIAGESTLIRLSNVAANTDRRPLQSGTASARSSTWPDLAAMTSTEVIQVQPSGSTGSYTCSIDMSPIARASALAAALQVELRKIVPTGTDSFDLGRATVSLVGDAASEQFLLVRYGTDGDSIALSDSGTSTLMAALGLDAGTNSRRYVVGGGTTGVDGDLPNGADITGSDNAPRTGIYALRDVDLFNILSIPDTMRLGDTEAGVVFAAATALAEEERAFYVLDVPQPAANARDQVAEIEDWISDNGALRHRNVATYYPRPRVADPLNDFLLRSVAPSGTAAGMYARTDAARGVWKAPAGTDATLRGVAALEYALTDAENGVVNPLGINALRNLPTFGRVVWGARTLRGADALADEYKYVPVRRTALYIEESLFRGLQWVVFEPNDEPLWASIRLNVGAFMQSLFRQGAFQGASPSEAYLVKCDAETTTQADIDLGIVNILVGFAPLKPAEFVVLKIQQLTSQSES